MTDELRKLIKGVIIDLGGEDYVVPPLNLEQLEEHKGIIDKLSDPEASIHDQRQIHAVLAAAALSRNYPDMTVERAKHIIDLGNINALVHAMMGVSGFQPAGESKPGE
jgi:hypothetical protein